MRRNASGNWMRGALHLQDLRALFRRRQLTDEDQPMNGGKMRVQRVVAGIALACLMALGPSHTARAGLQIDLVYIENPPQPGSPLIEGGGQLREIMRVAAESWERIFKRGVVIGSSPSSTDGDESALAFSRRNTRSAKPATTLRGLATPASFSAPTRRSRGLCLDSSPIPRHGTTPNTSNMRTNRLLPMSAGSISRGPSPRRLVMQSIESTC